MKIQVMKIQVMIASSLKSICRDSLLLFALGLPIFMTFVFRFLIPFVSNQLKDFVELTNYYALFQSVLLLMWPMMLGWIGGFLILDERDEGTLQSVAVTTGGKGLHLITRFSTLLVLGMVLSIVFLPLSDLFPIPPGHLVLLAFVNMFLSPVYMLALPAFAANKVEGLVVAKTFGLTLLPAFAVLLPSPMCHVGMIFPTYFLTQAVISGDSFENVIFYLLGGLVEMLLLIFIFFRRFQKETQ